MLGRRAYKPIMRAILPEFSANDLYSTIRHFDDSQAEIISGRIISDEDAFRDVAEVIPLVLAQAADGGYRGSDDPPFTKTIATYFSRRTRGRAMSEAEKSTLAAEVCATLLDASGGRGLTIAALDDQFRDPSARARLQALIDAVPAPRPAPAESDADDLQVYLNAVDTSGRGVSVAPEGVDAWQRLVATGGVFRSSDDDRLSGLSLVARTPAPELGAPTSSSGADADPLGADGERSDEIGDGRTPPLTESLYRRVRSVAKGASGRSWAHTLPSARDLVEQEIAGFGEAFQLATADGRAAVSVGLQAYLGSITDPHVLTVDRVGITADVAEALTTHRRWMESHQTAASRIISRRVASFLRGIGDKDATRGWAQLSQRSQDELSQLDRTLIPMLWRRVHNAQYRPGFFDDGIQAWSLVYGQFVTLIKEISERHKRDPGTSGTDAIESLDAPGAGATSSHTLHARLADYDDLTDIEAVPFKIHRDERVRETLAELREVDGWDALAAFLGDARLMRTGPAERLEPDAETPGERRRRLRETWRTAAERIAAGHSTATVEREIDGTTEVEHLHPALAATWHDFIGYLDDHLGA